MSTLEQRFRVLCWCNGALLLALTTLLLSGFATRSTARFDEITVERINVVGENGKPVMVIARRGRLPGPMANGREYPPDIVEGRTLLSGMLFFSEAGDEVGSLLYNTLQKADGYSAVGHLSLDQWRQNQVVALQYIDNGRTRRAGLQVIDRPTDIPMREELDRLEAMLGAAGPERDSLRAAHQAAQRSGAGGIQRVFLGSQDRTALVQLRDTRGRVRLRLQVDSLDVARLEVLDVDGNVTATFPEP
jgi:hypothetical protein